MGIPGITHTIKILPEQDLHLLIPNAGLGGPSQTFVRAQCAEITGASPQRQPFLLEAPVLVKAFQF